MFVQYRLFTIFSFFLETFDNVPSNDFNLLQYF